MALIMLSVNRIILYLVLLIFMSLLNHFILAYEQKYALIQANHRALNIL